MANHIRNMARRVFRGTCGLVAPDWLYERDQRSFCERVGLTRVAREVIAKSGACVAAGPFAGLTYLREATGSALCPKLLGIYELEIHPFLDTIIAEKYSVLHDVGAAEGYYAVGLAVRCPTLEIHAYDISPRARNLCRRLARINHVESRVHVHGTCSPATLAASLKGGELILCDCEGYELQLLDPAKVPALARTDMLVECHDHVHTGLTQTLRQRFAATHAIQQATTTPRDPTTVPGVAHLAPADQALAVDELRFRTQHWLFMQSRVRASTPSTGS